MSATKTAPPPHDLDAEESLLGAMLLAARAIEAAVEHVVTNDFYKPAHGHIFHAILTLHAAREPADPVTVAATLRQAGILDDIGGVAVLSSLQAGAPPTSNAGKYAAIIKGCAVRRRLIGAAGEMWAAAQDGDVDGALAIMEDARRTLASQSETDSWQEVDLQAVLDGDVESVVPLFMQRTDGEALAYPGKMHTYSAEPEAGKSWLALLAALQQIERGTSSEEKVRTSSVQDNANLICSCGPRGTPGSCDKEKFRAEVVTAARLLNEAASRVLGADASLKRAANLIDREAPHAPADYHDAAPRVVSRSELARAQAAQQRRALRGEGYGAA